jgi:trans-aconitate 2-methyltransferase
MHWQPKQYDSFALQRSAPINDLLKAIPQRSFKRIVDLGCGTGAAITLLKTRWPQAEIIGVDSDAAMLDVAKSNHPDISFLHCDIFTWLQNTSPANDTLIFSNAALHWLDDHRTLFLRLLGLIKNNGCLAVQMPNNWQQPSHVEMIKLAKSQPWAAYLNTLVREKPVWDLEQYDYLLSANASKLNTWTTTYNHNLKGQNPVVNWLMGSTLKYYLDGLPPEHHQAFLDQLGDSLAIAYPAKADGSTIFTFIRMFIVAQGQDQD